MRRFSVLLGCLVLGCATAPVESEERWIETALFDGTSLAGWERTVFGGEGEVEVRDGGLELGFGSPLTGVQRTDLGSAGTLPREDYELELVAARLGGSDFFCGLTFPIGDEHATLILGGWGGGLTGLSCIDGRDASENETTDYRSFPPGVEVRVRLRVTRHKVSAWLDGEPLFDVPRAGRRFHLRPEVALSAPLGIASFNTLARIVSVVLRRRVPAS